MTAATDSRLGPGTLTLGTTDFGSQLSNVALVPTTTSTDGTPTLGDPEPSPEETTTWSLKGSAVQDWAADAGFITYCFENAGEEVVFSWVPDTALDVEYTGTVKVRALDIGGDIAKQNASSFEFVVVGDPARTNVASAVPSIPLNLEATAESSTVIVLDWDAPATGSPTSYKVYQSSTLGGSYTEVTTNITKAGTTARLSSLTTATAYFFKVAAVNGSGTGSQTAAATATTL
jgi:hypothetical protein